MEILTIIYILIFIIFALIAYAVLQIKLFGIKVKDFWSFIEANQMLDKIFKAFDNVPDELWEEEYDKYKEVLKKYKDIKMLRWTSASNNKSG